MTIKLKNRGVNRYKIKLALESKDVQGFLLGGGGLVVLAGKQKACYSKVGVISSLLTKIDGHINQIP